MKRGDECDGLVRIMCERETWLVIRGHFRHGCRPDDYIRMRLNQDTPQMGQRLDQDTPLSGGRL